MKWGDLELTFKDNAASSDLQEQDGLPQFASYSNISASPASEQLDVDPKIETVNTELLEDMRRAQLMIDDPLAYEQAVIDEHVSRGARDAAVENRRA